MDTRQLPKGLLAALEASPRRSFVVLWPVTIAVFAMDATPHSPWPAIQAACLASALFSLLLAVPVRSKPWGTLCGCLGFRRAKNAQLWVAVTCACVACLVGEPATGLLVGLAVALVCAVLLRKPAEEDGRIAG